MVFHGHLRTTAALDLVLDLETANIVRAIAALTGLGFRPRAPVPAEDFADKTVRDAWVADEGMTVFSLWNPKMPGFEVDLFDEAPFDFVGAAARAVRAPLEITEAPVVSIDDLIQLNRAAGRPQDLQDIAALEELRRAGSGESASND